MRNALGPSYSPAERLDTFMKFLGYGNPFEPFPGRKGSLWFIGIEEALDSCETSSADASVIKCYGKQWKHTDVDATTEKTGVYVTIAKLAVLLNEAARSDGEEHCHRDADNWATYRRNELFQEHSRAGVFQTNLYPLGKPRATEPLPTHYWEIFGFDDSNSYQRICENQRWQDIRNLKSQAHPWLTICFGKNYWDKFSACLKLGEKESRGQFELYKRDGVILTPFFSSRPNCMPNKRILELASIIRSFPFT